MKQSRRHHDYGSHCLSAVVLLTLFWAIFACNSVHCTAQDLQMPQTSGTLFRQSSISSARAPREGNVNHSAIYRLQTLSIQSPDVQQTTDQSQEVLTTSTTTTPASLLDAEKTDLQFADGPQLTREQQRESFMSQLPENESHLVKFIELLQWAVVVSIVAVVAALVIRRFQPQGIQLSRNTLIEHLASLRVTNQFHAHVLEINDQRFLVTTDRSGVKTVNQMATVGDFETALKDVA